MATVGGQQARGKESLDYSQSLQYVCLAGAERPRVGGPRGGTEGWSQALGVWWGQGPGPRQTGLRPRGPSGGPRFSDGSSTVGT